MLTIVLVPFLLAMFLAANMGGSGTAPSFAAAYGAGLIRREQIAGLFGLMVFAGALLAGEKVSLTMGKGLLDAEHFTIVVTSVILASVGLSLLIANLIGIPQSTSQATVLSLAGAALYLQGLNTQKLLFEIIPTWFVMPAISFFLMLGISKFVLPFVKTKRTRETYKEVKGDGIMRWVVLASSMYVAFAIGSSNVANAAGPVASMVITSLGMEPVGEQYALVTLLSMLVVAPCFAIGSSLLGYKVTKTTGKDIIPIGPFAASIIAFLTASLVLSVSWIKGIPTSLVQLNTGAIIAYSISKRGLTKTFQNPKVWTFFGMWLIAPIFAFGLSYLLMMLAKHWGLL